MLVLLEKSELIILFVLDEGAIKKLVAAWPQVWIYLEDALEELLHLLIQK